MKLTHPMTLIPLAILILIIALIVNNMIRNRPYQPPVNEETEDVVEDGTTGASNPLADELDLRILEEGEPGIEARDGDTLSVHYTGTFEDGTEFDSSRDRGPFNLTLGQNRVIQGWELGLQGARVGERRQITVPPELGYGSTDYSGIPANSTLHFEIEILSIDRPE